MRGIAIECACEAAYIAVSFSVGLDEPLYNSTKSNASRPSRRRRGKGNSSRSSAGPLAPRGAASTIAHLAEHVVATLTSATETDTEAALGIVRATGIRHNAETSASETCFHAAGSADDLERIWLPRLFEAIRTPNLTAECVETERSAALDEMYAFRARAAVSDGKLDAHIASVEAQGSWLTRVDEDIQFLENESADRIGAMIGAFIQEYYVPARMHVTVVGNDTGSLLERARAGHSTTRPRQTLRPRAVFPWTNWRAGAVSVIAGSEGDTTRVRFCNSCVVSSDPASVLAAECAAWCVAELLFVELRVRSNAIYSVHASLEMRAVTNEERDGDHDAAIVVATVCTHDKAPLVACAMRDAFGAISPKLVRDWARARRVSIDLESRAANAIGERAREVSFAATNDPISRRDRLELIDAVTHDAARASVAGAGAYRVYASTADASKPSSVRRAIERALAG